MKIKEKQAVEVVHDLLCDVCLESTRVEGGSLQYAVLQAHWGYGGEDRVAGANVPRIGR